MAYDEFGQITNETQQGNVSPKQQFDRVVDESNADQQKSKEPENVESTERITPIVNNGEEFERKYGYDKPAPSETGSNVPKVREEILNHFRDQNRPFAPGESVTPENPSLNPPVKNELSDIKPRQQNYLQRKWNLGELDNTKSEKQDPPLNPPVKNELSDIKPGQQNYLQRKLGELNNTKSEEQDPLGYIQQRFAQEQSQTQSNFADDVSKEIKDAESTVKHNDALNSNARANEGFSATKPLSETGQNFFAKQDLISENARLQEEIYSLRKDMEDIKAKLDTLLGKNTSTEVTQPTTVVKDTEQIEPLPEQAEGEPIPIVLPQQETVNTPGQVQQAPETINIPSQETLTPEQKYTQLLSERDTLLNGRSASELTDEEKIKYAEMTITLDAMRLNMGRESEDTERRKKRKEKIIAWTAGVAGAGVGFGVAATAPVSIAAVVAVTLGGRFATPLIKRWGTNLQTKATTLKFEDRRGKTPEEIAEIDKKIRRNEWWGKRLGEVAAVVSGGTAGFGVGVMAHSLFTTMAGGTGIQSTPETTSGTGINEAQFPQGGEQASEILQTDPGLVKDGRVNLPDSAWNGNLAGEPTGNLPGGEFNHSNYAGGVHEMAAYQLNKDLIASGITPEQLGTLSTGEIHKGLLNGYLDAINSGINDPNLVDILGRINSEGARNLLSIISR